MINAAMTGFFTTLKTYPLSWATGVSRTVGDVIKPTTYNSHTYVCSVAGTSHATTEPTWSTTNGGTTVDGTATWVTYDMKCYNVKAPQGSTLPYVTFGLNTDRPMGEFTDQQAMEDLTFWVNVFSSISVAHLTTLTDRVLAVLDDASLTVTGYTGMRCVREFMGAVIWDMETETYQIPLRYRIWLDKS